MAHFLAEKVPGIVIPKDLMERMDSAPDEKGEGLSIALRTIKALRKVEGVHGVHIMAINWDDIVSTLVKQAGLLPRPRAPREPL
jgi:methylenetetrahydrofolate reductase (NADPH)